LAKLIVRRDPDWKSLLSISTANGSEKALLVTWHKIQSPRLASASTIAGRSLVCDKSVKGNRTTTTEPAASKPMPHPPRDDSSRTTRPRSRVPSPRNGIRLHGRGWLLERASLREDGSVPGVGRRRFHRSR